MERIRKRVEISKENVDWFHDTYPGGSLSWIVDRLLYHFREAHTMTPNDYSMIGARELKKVMEEEK